MATRSLTLRAARSDELAAIIDVDDDASRRYATAGMELELTDEHPFVVAEQARWAASLAKGRVIVAEAGGALIGIAVLGIVDGSPFLDQLSVRMRWMGRGVGRALLARAIEWAELQGGALWLDTYDHLEWNRPFYERAGFEVVGEERVGPELRAILALGHECLPEPHRRVVMRRASRA